MNQQKPLSPQMIEESLGLTRGHSARRWLGRALLVVLALLLVAGGLYWYGQRQSAATAISYETQPAKVADLTVTVSATGTIQPITQVEIGSEQSGVVRQVLVEENDAVKTGQPLATLDTARLEAQRARMAAQVAAAEARVANAKAALEESQQTQTRQNTLRKRGLSTGQDMDTADAAVARNAASLKAAEADVASAKADLVIIDTDLAKTRIVSPIDGVVLKRQVEPGQTVAASLQAPVLFKIAQDLTRIQLEAAVDEADIGDVKLGQSATFTVDAYRNRSFPARIERLSYAPETVDGVVTYKAVLSAPNDDLALRPGMTATARITTELYKNVLTVPNEALRYAPPVERASRGFSITQMFVPRMPRSGTRGQATADGKRSIYVLRQGSPQELKVETGASDGKVTQIVSGDLKPDDPVIVAQKQAR